MAPARAAAALAALACCGRGLAGSGGRSAQQVVETLRHLHESLDEAASRADEVDSEVSSRCRGALSRLGGGDDFSGPPVAKLRAALAQQEADVEERKTAARHVRADIALAERALQQANAMRGASAELLSSRRMAVASFQGELEVLVPAVAQLQERSTETARRVEARGRAAASAGRLSAALREGCARSAGLAAAQSTSRANEQGLIATAKAALQQLVIEPDAEVSLAQLKTARVHRQPVDDDDAAPADEAEDAAADDDEGLDDIFSKAQDHPAAPATTPPAAELALEPPAAPAAKSGKSVDAVLQKLLAEVKASSKADDRAWCSEERARADLAAQLANNSAAELAREAAEHGEVEAQLAADLAKLRNASTVAEAASKGVSGGLWKQRGLAASRAKELALATRILSQAVHVLGVLESDASGDEGAEAQRLFGQAADSLRQAGAYFQEEAKSQAEALEELAKSAKAVAESFASCSSDFAAEGQALDFARSAHSAARARAEATRRSYDEDLKAASKYAADLARTCGEDASAAGAQEEAAEARALEDAEAMLHGKAIVASAQPASSGLRGATAAKDAAAKLQNLSPLERAAQEMGVAIN